MSATDQALVNATAQAIADAWAWPSPSWDDVARAAIAAVLDHECCARCGCALQPPTLCEQCARSPAIRIERQER